MKAVARRLLPGAVLPLVDRIESSPIASRLVRGTFWSLVGTVFARGLSVLSSIVAARQLGKVGFGEFGIIQSTMLSLSVVISYGLGTTATKYIAEFRFSNPARAGRIMALSGIVACAAGASLSAGLAIIAPWLATRILAAPQLVKLLRVGALFLFLSTLNGAQIGALSGFEAFRTVARVNLITGIATFASMVGGVFLAGLTGMVWGLVISAGFGWLMGHLAVREEASKCGVTLTFRGIFGEIAILRNFSLPAILASALYGPVGWVCSAMLVNEPDGYAQMGIFNATIQWFALVMFIPGLLGQVVLPMLSESVGAGDDARSRRILHLTMMVNALVVAPLVLLASLASPWLMSLYGDGYAHAWPVLVISLVTAGLLAIQSPVGQSLNAEGRLWTVYFMNLGWAVLFIGTNALLVKQGAAGLASARMAAYLFQTVVTALLVFRPYRRRLNAAGI